ncbi:MAG: hypothetical protein ACT4P8_07985 [Betaproteobacteria bacterium]
MKDTWYADQRDLVKWGTLAHLAERHGLATIVQVAYLRPGARGVLSNGSGEVPISPAVWSFFRNVTAIRGLGERLQRQIVVVDAPFVPQRRRQYRQAVIESVRTVAGSKIVLLDPDTGIAPAKPSGKHVTTEDISAVWDILLAGDWLAVYQHQSRDRAWKQNARDKFSAVCGDDIELFSAPTIAADVVFLAARKPRPWRPRRRATCFPR